MKEYNISNNLVVCSEFKVSENSEILTELQHENISKFLGHLDDDVVVVLGGDGSMLEAIDSYYPTCKKFFGVNFGNKGFLLHSQDILKNTNPSFKKKYYPLISYKDSDSRDFAFNELDIKAGDGKMLDLEIEVDGSYSTNILGDGLLISTPAGSTGYNSAMRGPILEHDMNAYILHPKASWEPRGVGPIILSDKKSLHITGKGRISPCEVYTDGRNSQTYNSHIDLHIEILPQEIEFYIESSHLESWNNKLLTEQGFNS